MRSMDELRDTEQMPFGLWDIRPLPEHTYGAMMKLPDCGTVSVVWGYNEKGYEHVSVSPMHKFRIPTWNDMATLKDRFFYHEEEAYQIMPKHSEYVNLVENCLHLWRPANGRMLAELVTGEKENGSE